ncbi:MAG: hypothetical protein AB7G38_01480 [Dehalococcoidia bacterium]
MIQRRLFLVTILGFFLIIAGGSGLPFGMSFAGLTDEEKVNGSAQAGYWNGNITITKNAVPNSTTLFTFRPSGGSISTTPFTLEDDGDLNDGKLPSKTYTGIAPGTYTFEESATAGYKVTSIVCTVTGGHGSTVSIRGAVTNTVFDEGDDTVVISLQGGDAVECVFENTLVVGDIVIRKDAAPNSSTVFDFTAASNPTGHITPTTFTLQDNGNEADGSPSSRTFNDLDAPGVYTFTEEAETGYKITNITCTVTGTAGSTYKIAGVTNDSTFQDGEYTVNVTLMAGDTVDCTFKNEPTVGTIKITKDTVPNSETVFDFSAAGGSISPTAFTLQDDGSESDGQPKTRTFTSLNAPVSYTFSEQGEAGYKITGISCDVTGSGGSTYSISGVTNDTVFQTGESTVTINLKADDTAECTFTNEPLQGTIRIVKDVTAFGGVGTESDSQDFAFTTSGTGLSNFTLDDDLDATRPSFYQSPAIAPGTYVITEGAVNNWNVTGISCTGASTSTIVIGPFVPANGGTNGFDPGDYQVTITLADDENIICTFKNTESNDPGVQQCLTILGNPPLSTVEVIFGTSGNDNLQGSSTKVITIILGFGGADKINGNNTVECIVGGPGNDEINGNNGSDFIFGGDGDDDIKGGGGPPGTTDYCEGNAGTDLIDQCETINNP